MRFADVELKQPPLDQEPRPSAADLGMHSGTCRHRGDGRSCISIRRRARSTSPTTAAPHGSEERNFIRVLAIVAGTTVDFPNSDPTYHNVFSLSKTQRFDLGRYAAGRSKAVRFDQPGIVRVFCDIHSHMSAFILVFAHRYFAVTDEDRRYRIDNVRGNYSVVAWHEAPPLTPGAVADGGDVDLNFTLAKS